MIDRTHQRAKPIALASYFLNNGQPRRALDILESSSDISLEDPRVWYIRGRSLYNLNDFKGAEVAVEAGLALDPNGFQLLAVVGDVRTKLGKFAGAELAYLDALRQIPGSPPLLCAYAHLAARFGQMAKALALVDEAARIAPDDLQVLQTKVGMAYLRGDDREAARLCHLLLEQFPEDAYGHRMLAVTTRSTSSAHQMLERMRVAARLDPTSRKTIEATRRYQVLALWPFRPLGWLMMGGSERRALLIVVVVVTLFESHRSTVGLGFLIALAFYLGVLPSIAAWWLHRRRP